MTTNDTFITRLPEHCPGLEEEMESIDQAMSISLFHKPYTELILRRLEKDFVDKVWSRAMQPAQFNDYGAGI